MKARAFITPANRPSSRSVMTWQPGLTRTRSYSWVRAVRRAALRGGMAACEARALRSARPLRPPPPGLARASRPRRLRTPVTASAALLESVAGADRRVVAMADTLARAPAPLLTRFWPRQQRRLCAGRAGRRRRRPRRGGARRCVLGAPQPAASAPLPALPRLRRYAVRRLRRARTHRRRHAWRRPHPAAGGTAWSRRRLFAASCAAAASAGGRAAQLAPAAARAQRAAAVRRV